MQQFKPYYLGEKSPFGKNAASCQKCIRTSDIEEVGDERHLTFFEMLGNFSFGGYWKEEAIKLAYKFVAEELKLEIDYVTVFSPTKVESGDWRKDVPEDLESYEIWKKVGVPESKIRKEGVDNFWGPTGEEGPCGPTTEIYVKGIEIWNVVFNEFFCSKEKNLTKLDIQGIDTGMGLERLAAVVQNVPTVFDTDLFDTIIDRIVMHKPGGVPPKDSFVYEKHIKNIRIIADHIKSAVFLISDGVLPSNTGQGYILRRLIRRAVISMNYLNISARPYWLVGVIIEKYQNNYKNLFEKKDFIENVINEEELKFLKTFNQGLSKIKDFIDKWGAVAFGNKYFAPEDIEKIVFDLYQNHGFPIEVSIEEFEKAGMKNIDKNKISELFQEHQELSRTASAGMFKGGLADHSPETVKLHTAHHLLLAALQEMFGKTVKQRGSNINSERLRFDFSFDRKLTDEEKKRVEELVNQKIKEALPVVKKEMPIEEAKKIGAEMEFGVKYGNTVSVYFIENKDGTIFSKEFCGGPHVNNTAELGKFKIIKEESSSVGVRRIKAVLEKN